MKIRLFTQTLLATTLWAGVAYAQVSETTVKSATEGQITQTTTATSDGATAQASVTTPQGTMTQSHTQVPLHQTTVINSPPNEVSQQTPPQNTRVEVKTQAPPAAANIEIQMPDVQAPVVNTDTTPHVVSTHTERVIQAVDNDASNNTLNFFILGVLALMLLAAIAIYYHQRRELEYHIVP